MCYNKKSTIKYMGENGMRNFVGVDLGGTAVKIGIVREDGHLVHKISIPTNSSRGALAVIDSIGAAVKKMLADVGIDSKQIAGLGMGSPGYVDSKEGVVVYNNNLGWRNIPVVQELRKYVDVPVFINNDANAAAIGESAFGAAHSYANSVFVTLGTGVGGGVIVNNKIFEGYKSTGTELGHMKIGDKGNKCTCGRTDCWETYSSATALTRETIKKMNECPGSSMWDFAGELEAVDGRTSFECAKTGDKAAKEVVDEYILYLADGILNVSNIFGPQAVLIGGGICAQGDFLIKPLQEFMAKNKYGGALTPDIVVERATLGNNAGIFGGAALALTMLD